MQPGADIGVVGLAVMGQNLVLNMSDHGYTVVVFNRTLSKIDQFLAGPAKSRVNILGAHGVEELVKSLKRPRKILLMVKAGQAVDQFIAALLPYLEPGDLIIDAGNSHYSDSMRRTQALEERDLLFIGTGVSGGEEGARRGPSMMPGGSFDAWALVEKLFKDIAAKTPDGTPCCEWIGSDGAGHYVKMIHNGIEYGDMQLIAEAYHLMKTGLNLTNFEISRIFKEWNKTELDSYLVEITGDILARKDQNGESLVDKILDSAAMKGTGVWTSESSLELGIPLTLITEAVYARSLSALKEDRTRASEIIDGPVQKLEGDRNVLITEIRKALLASKIVSYAQGFMLMRAAAEKFNWDLDYGRIALIWRGGCIIRSAFLDQIKEAFDRNRSLSSLVVDSHFKGLVDTCIQSWRNVVSAAVKAGIPVPAFSSALAFYDGYRSRWLPANLIQAQRDFFGAHTYERTDKPRGEFFHTEWAQG
ncbi:MAG: decarboxylating NADP(+)-dependent phosphogluconate dehydrogenase [Fibrobacter sp.]|nr:decarboxylating NADP(+)-dependent phosphogluconate dehydrogenase [Fibrobacter sp.]